ncbi:MAG: iron-containing alcohol dehydrogenase family protein [Faecalibacterium sp.]|jgi:glycerol dehydrogenase|nr:iron-containing alcohol dehydrogenase family protein [Faecalibacterium sp.]
MKSYTDCLPAWSVGPDCYGEVYSVVRRFGRTAAVIGGKTALEKAYPVLKAAMKEEPFTLSEPVWYGGNSTYENVEKLEAMDAVKNADMIFGVGGGRAVDTCKAVAEHLDKPLFTFPTIASNCAACTAIGVFYNADDTFCNYFYPTRCPEHTFINTQVIAEAPERLLWAGIGDALSKECEVELATRGKELFHTPLLGAQLARACTNPLVECGAKAMRQVQQKQAGYELEQVALDIIVSTGIVSNLTSAGEKYYYNSSLAHCVYYGATMVPASGGQHLHGEIVSFGVLTLLTYDRQFAERDRLLAFNHSIGLPVTLAQVDLAEKDLQTVADKAATVLEWTRAPYAVTKEAFMQAMRDADAAGRAYLAKQ